MTDHSSTDASGWRAVKRRAAALLRTAIVLAVAATWIAFWGIVVRIQLLQLQYLSAAFTVLLFVLPAAVGVFAYLDPLPDPGRAIDIAAPDRLIGSG